MRHQNDSRQGVRPNSLRIREHPFDEALRATGLRPPQDCDAADAGSAFHRAIGLQFDAAALCLLARQASTHAVEDGFVKTRNKKKAPGTC